MSEKLYEHQFEGMDIIDQIGNAYLNGEVSAEHVVMQAEFLFDSKEEKIKFLVALGIMEVES